MRLASPIRDLVAADATVREIAREWRRLTGGSGVRDDGRRTLLACSGGADSSALVLALSCSISTERLGLGTLVVGHVVHGGMRGDSELEADRSAAAELAALCGMEFLSVEVRVPSTGANAEGSARRLRYGALAKLAVGAGCAAVATAHQADDQAETVLMRLMRGAGPAGLGGIARGRWLGGELSGGSPVRLVRPMLGVERAQSERICGLARWPWREDATNADLSRRRAMLRHSVLPLVRSRWPGALGRIAETAEACRDAGACIDELARELDVRARVRWEAGFGWVYERGALRSGGPVIVGELIRRSVRALGGTGMDRITRRALMKTVGAVRSPSGEERAHQVGPFVVRISAREVMVGAAEYRLDLVEPR